MKKSEQKINEILSYLEDFIFEHGYSPSYREISKAVNLKSTNSVKEYLDILEQQNQIKRQPTKNRTIEIIARPKQEVIDLPVVGQVAAGVPILAEQNIEDTITISSSFFGVKDSKSNNLFVLKVKGESMIEIGINDGDYVVANSQNVAENGEVVVAMIDGEATVKSFYKESTRIRLEPANKLFSPIYSSDVTVLGKVVGVIRRF